MSFAGPEMLSAAFAQAPWPSPPTTPPPRSRSPSDPHSAGILQNSGTTIVAAPGHPANGCSPRSGATLGLTRPESRKTLAPPLRARSSSRYGIGGQVARAAHQDLGGSIGSLGNAVAP